MDDARIMDDLLLHGLPIDVPHPLRHTTALMEATRLGRTEMVKCLLTQGAAQALLNGFAQGTALHCAIRRHQWAIATLLVETCACPDCSDAYGNTPLHTTCMDTLDEATCLPMMDIVNVLVGKGCALDILNKEGITALHYSVINDTPPLTELLLVHGAHPDMATPEMHTTPLMIAALEKNTTICGLLLQHGANPHARNSDGRIALDMFPNIQRLAAEQSVSSYMGGNGMGGRAAPRNSRMN